MEILLTVEFYYPSVGGAQFVVKTIAEKLVARGHQVTVATSKISGRKNSVINGVRIKEFDISGNLVRGISGDAENYLEHLKSSSYDVMMNYAAQQWTTDLTFQVLDQLIYPAIIAPCGFSGLYLPEYRDYFTAMPKILCKYSHIILHSSSYRDAIFIKLHGLENYTVVPNGAGEEFEECYPDFRTKYNIRENEPLLLSVGSHTGLKGHNLVIEAFAKANIGRSTLVLIGNSLGRGGCIWNCRKLAIKSSLITFGKKRVILMNPPRSDVISAFQAADLFLFGSEIEVSPLVLLEAMASHTPFISTACGNAEEIIEWGKSGVLVPSYYTPTGLVKAKIDDYSQKVDELWGNSSLRNLMAKNGYDTWKKYFTWDKVVSQYEDIFLQVISKGIL